MNSEFISLSLSLSLSRGLLLGMDCLSSSVSASVWVPLKTSNSLQIKSAPTTIWPSDMIARGERRHAPLLSSKLPSSSSPWFGDVPLPRRMKRVTTTRRGGVLMIPCSRLAPGGDGNEEEEEEKKKEEELDEALQLDERIPTTSDQFLKRVSSRAYDMRRHLKQTIDSSSYDVLDDNPWGGDSKPVYVLTQNENQLWTMKTRRNRSEVEKELGILFSKGGRWRGGMNSAKQSTSGAKFRMLVEDVREGVLIFEDEEDATKYCDLLQGGGEVCEGVTELEASSVFNLCNKMRAFAVLFRRGRTPPMPDRLKLNLRAKRRSLED